MVKNLEITLKELTGFDQLTNNHKLYVQFLSQEQQLRNSIRENQTPQTISELLLKGFSLQGTRLVIGDYENGVGISISKLDEIKLEKLNTIYQTNHPGLIYIHVNDTNSNKEKHLGYEIQTGNLIRLFNTQFLK